MVNIHNDNTTTCRSERGFISDSDSVKLRKQNPKKYVSYECEHILFSSSFQLIIPILFSLYCKLYYMSIFDIFLFITSFLHWRNPELGLRRDNDMLMVLLNSIAKGFFAFSTNSMCAFIFLFGVITIVSLYWIGQKFNYNAYSTLCHLSLHSVGTFSTITLYYFSKELSIDKI
ncbi:conserved Plasmodium protein, unknown function [Plasmodium berghei]|uniref:Uncharacterized protein n=2 Tax=Plasmodium berghei TaxID=5821 RepID=A0A509AQH6_PLABA|nr:conserved protein, unknown function [Plasmodium berghei ANKA]SCM25092.1 conserved Plasmodium protein, unknown function [Plasmodium berghei]SCN27259.1 conserved Plasmodium protein, unknown function [Plasmodium berghei]SCO63685.1 conserved Plasmodium protein, unknown function [Plasmodium berghei]VUC57116.1 conserved protein, unknown function [Plasmodium berghei ANKA]|eukprot:XP_034422895.1 conserved protein, unknown function [Plasmodium berghei ANKA]